MLPDGPRSKVKGVVSCGQRTEQRHTDVRHTGPGKLRLPRTTLYFVTTKELILTQCALLLSEHAGGMVSSLWPYLC